MSIAGGLGDFGARTNALLRATWAFTLPLNVIVTCGPVAWNAKTLDPVPFSRAMLRLERELRSLSTCIAASAVYDFLREMKVIKRP